jgi:protein required for attachment to host cells
MKLKAPKCWYLVADAGRAAAYERRAAGKGYEQVANWTPDLMLPEEARAQFTDRPGRLFDSLGGQRHATETVSPRELGKQAFGRALARTLAEARANGAFDVVALFAAPRFLHQLREQFDKSMVEAVVHSEAKDLTKLPMSELHKVFESIEVTPKGATASRASGATRR